MSLADQSFFFCSLPTFATLADYKGVKAMVKGYPQEDEEVQKRLWLGHIYPHKRQPKTYVGEAGPLGLGLFAGEDIVEGQVIGEYTGLIKRRRPFIAARKDYVGEYTIPGYPVRYIIDAEHYGSLMRFVNHSSSANVYSITVIVEGLLRVYFIAKCPIAASEQLFLDYGPAYWRWRTAVR